MLKLKIYWNFVEMIRKKDRKEKREDCAKYE